MASTNEDPGEKADQLREIAEVQAGAGDRAEGLVTLRLALQAARVFKGGNGFGRRYRFDREDEEIKAEALAKIAKAQAGLGDPEGSRKTYLMATESANSVQDHFHKVRTLVTIAGIEDPTARSADWKYAREFALAPSEPFVRGRALQVVLREGLRVGAR